SNCDNPVANGSDIRVHSRVQSLCTPFSPRGDSNYDVVIQYDGTTGVSLATVLAADVEDSTAEHVVSDVRQLEPWWPLLVEEPVAFGTNLLVDFVHLDFL
ncbi:unnamed protein product, partial [Plutella xylostella]